VERNKVQTSTDSRFANTKAIQEAHILNRDQEIISVDSISTKDSDITKRCIEVKAL